MNKQLVILLLLAVLAVTGGLMLRAQYSRNFPQQVPGQIARQLTKVYDEIDREAQQLLADTALGKAHAWDEAEAGFLLVDSSGIIAWNRSDFIPDAASLQAQGQFQFLSGQRGEFVLRKWQAGNGRFLVNVLPLRNRYPIANGFLPPRVNPALFEVSEVDVVGPGASIGTPVAWNQEVLFRVVAPREELRDSAFSFLFLLVGFVLLLWSLLLTAKRIHARLGPDVTLVVLVGALYALRLAMVRTGLPGLYFKTDVFDPRVFASSDLNASLGDLLLNGICVLVLVIYVFQTHPASRSVRWMLQQPAPVRFVMGALFLFLSLLGVLLSYNFIEVIYHNSSLTLDLSQSVAFDLSRGVAFLAVLAGTVSAFLFMHLTASLSRHLLPTGVVFFVSAMLAAAALFVAQYVITGNDNSISLALGLIMLTGIRMLQFDHLEFRFSFRLFLYFVFGLTTFSVHHSLAVRGFHEERLVRDQFRYAKDFLAERDVLGEYLLDQARQRIAGDPFIQTRMASPFFSKDPISEKIRRVHLNRYFDRYELTIRTHGTSDTTARPAGSWKPTDFQGIYFSGKTGGEALKRYRVEIPIFHQRPVGTVVLELVLKRLLPDNVFPELLVDNRFSQLYRNRDFSFAIFQDNRVINRFGSFHYERDFSLGWLSDSLLYARGIHRSGYCHVALEEGDGAIAVVSALDYSWQALVTNVSFWFVLGLLLLLFVQGLLGLAALRSGTPVAYTARIQVFMLLAFALPMVTVSITVLTLMGKSSEETTRREFLERSAAAAQRLATLYARQPGQETGRMEEWVTENAAYAKTDITVFSPNGSLLVTSQPALYENQLVSTRMNREAYRRLVLDGERQAVTNERIGALGYNSAYASVLSPATGKLEAIVSLPFFESASYLQRGQFLVISNILQVFVVVFLVFTLVSFLAADSLAAPIRLMARTLRQTTLDGGNKPLRWETRDEFGVLAQEYNRMVTNLDESRRALARQEKESAWREMAKQVAHEIKNPLTPMKLTLQKMERDILAGSPADDKLRKSIEVLLRQVDILSSIASSFSTFAQLPAPAPQRIDFGRLVSETTVLISHGDEVALTVDVPTTPLWISADPASIGRAIFNVLINAVQARREGEKAIVTVRVFREADRVRLSVADQGRGIPAHDKERVFQPQFTTKASGSGLGLAMARQALLQAGGQIWFESVPNGGTIFYLEIPLDGGGDGGGQVSPGPSGSA